MRDGQGNKLSPEEEAKVKSVVITPGPKSVSKVSIDPKPGLKPIADPRNEPEPLETETAPKF